MEAISKVLLIIHIAAGICSVLLFWIPVFTKKGGVNHRKIGKWYIRLMWIVVASASLLTVKNVIVGSYSKAVFLGFLALITSNPLWYGIQILNHKKGTSSSFKRLQTAFHFAIVLSAFGLIGYGIYLGGKGSAVLMFVFAGLGLTDIPNLIKDLKPKKVKTDWLKEHIVGMCSSGIAAYTAFFVFGMGQFFQSFLYGYWTLIPWVAPGLIGGLGINYAVKRYIQKKEGLKVKA